MLIGDIGYVRGCVLFTCGIWVGSMLVGVELGLGRHHRGKLFGRLLLRHGDAGAARRRRGLHPTGHLTTVATDACVPHASGEKREK